MSGVPTSLQFVQVLRRVFLAGVGLAVLLAGLGLLVYPTALAEWQSMLPGLAAVIIVLGAYALLGAWGTSRLERLDARLPRLAMIFGLLAAVVYAAEIVLEYMLQPRDNTNYGLAEFGLVFLLYLLAGLVAARQTRRARNGPLAAMGAALVSTLLWYIVLLAITYALKGRPQQAAVFRAEGNYDDFTRSGSASFDAWLMQDFLGAGFYHLLLGPIIAAVLGTVGGLIGKSLSMRQGGIQGKSVN
jgi:hypothetical protein